jgi:hypothetical protein
VYSKSHEAEQEEDYSPEYIEKVTEFDVEEESIITEEESTETVEEEVEIYFQGSNESTENIVKVREKESQEYSQVSAPVKEKSSQSYNAFTEFFKETEALKTKQEDVSGNPSTPAKETGLTGNVASEPKVEDLNEDLIDISVANRDGETKEANDESEIMSNVPSQDEINVISALQPVQLTKFQADFCFLPPLLRSLWPYYLQILLLTFVHQHLMLEHL